MEKISGMFLGKRLILQGEKANLMPLLKMIRDHFDMDTIASENNTIRFTEEDEAELAR